MKYTLYRIEKQTALFWALYATDVIDGVHQPERLIDKENIHGIIFAKMKLLMVKQPITGKPKAPAAIVESKSEVPAPAPEVKTKKATK